MMVPSKRNSYGPCLKKIEYDILCGRLKPRERLVESDLMERYRVTRGTIRKVFRELEFKQLVFYMPNRGVMVFEPSPKEMEDLFNLRVLLENYALDTAIEQMDAKTLEQVEKYQISFEESIKRNKFKEIFDSNVNFHRSINKTSGNQILCETIDQLRIRAHLWQQYLVGHPDRLEESTNEHWIIIGCLKSRDSKRLKDINYKHIHMGYKCYLDDQQRIA